MLTYVQQHTRAKSTRRHEKNEHQADDDQSVKTTRPQRGGGRVVRGHKRDMKKHSRPKRKYFTVGCVPQNLHRYQVKKTGCWHISAPQHEQTTSQVTPAHLLLLTRMSPVVAATKS